MLAKHNLAHCPTLQFVQDRKLIELLSLTEIRNFDERLKNGPIDNSKNEERAELSLERNKENLISDNQLENDESNLMENCQMNNYDSNLMEICQTNNDECNDEDWCPVSLYRFRAMASQFRPCNLTFSFHIAAITHKMLNIYENEQETDLHDFLTNEDLCIMSRHQYDEDQEFNLIFQPKYQIRPNAQMVRDKIDEYINVENMKFNVDITEDSDFFADAWNVKSSPFCEINKKEELPKAKKKMKKR